jgi:hypothetical protein
MDPYRVMIIFADENGYKIGSVPVALVHIPSLGETIDVSRTMLEGLGEDNWGDNWEDKVWVVKDIRHSIRNKVDKRGAIRQGIGLWVEPRRVEDV